MQCELSNGRLCDGNVRVLQISTRAPELNYSIAARTKSYHTHNPRSWNVQCPRRSGLVCTVLDCSGPESEAPVAGRGPEEKPSPLSALLRSHIHCSAGARHLRWNSLSEAAMLFFMDRCCCAMFSPLALAAAFEAQPAPAHWSDSAAVHSSSEPPARRSFW